MASGEFSAPWRVARVEAARLIDLRHRVLREGMPRESASFVGDDEPDAIHLAAFDSADLVVGCCSLIQRPWKDSPAWQLRGMAVDPGLRRSGVGKRLLETLEAFPEIATHSPQLWCNAREIAVDFYKSQGWTIQSERFEIATAGPHYVMSKRVLRDHVTSVL